MDKTILLGAVAYDPKVVTDLGRHPRLLPGRRARRSTSRCSRTTSARSRRCCRPHRHRLEHAARARARAAAHGRPRRSRWACATPTATSTRSSSCARDAGIRSPADLAGKTSGRRQPRLDAGAHPAAALPAARRASISARVQLLPFDTDLGKHGDTGHERAGRARARCTTAGPTRARVGDLVWVTEQAAGRVDPDAVEVALDDARASTTACSTRCRRSIRAKRDGFQRALFAMRWDEPAHRRLLELEGLQGMAAAARGGLREPGARRSTSKAAGERDAAGGASTAATCPSAAACWRWSVRRWTCSSRAACSRCSRRSRSAREDLPSWCRVERTCISAREALDDGRDRHLIERGAFGIPRGGREPAVSLAPRNGRLLSADVLAAVPFPERADPAHRLRSARARGRARRAALSVHLLEREHVAPPEVAQLYDQAVAAQWDAARDIPWDALRPLPPALERRSDRS